MFAKRGVTNEELPMTSAEKKAARKKAARAVKALSSHAINKTHNAHIHYSELKALGLNVQALETPGSDEFQDTVMTIHHCYMHTLMNTPAIKLIEGHTGNGMIKVIQPNQPNPSGQPTADLPPL